MILNEFGVAPKLKINGLIGQGIEHNKEGDAFDTLMKIISFETKLLHY